MKCLALETAVSPGSIAVAEIEAGATRVIRSASLPEEERTARSLAPALDKLLSEAGWQAKQLDLVAVTTGPGSFTGLRIGITTAKTLAYVAGAKCVAINTLAVLAAQVTDDAASGWAVLDAQRRELFAAPFTNGKLTAEPVIVSEEEWLAGLEPNELVTGPGLSRLQSRLPEGARAAEQATWAPRAETVARLAAASETRVTPFELLPNYYRLSAAEEKLQK